MEESIHQSDSVIQNEISHMRTEWSLPGPKIRTWGTQIFGVAEERPCARLASWQVGGVTADISTVEKRHFAERVLIGMEEWACERRPVLILGRADRLRAGAAAARNGVSHGAD
jgi:hypothetical protein